MAELIRWLLIAVGLFFALGSPLCYVRSTHWFIRGWEFPRMQIMAILGTVAALYYIFFLEGGLAETGFLLLMAAGIVFQFAKVLPYTPLAPKMVQRSSDATAESSIRLLIANLLMENDRHDLFLRCVSNADPDVVMTLEVNSRWQAALKPLERKYPHHVQVPQDNCFGMCLYSRLPLLEPQVRYIVQDDIPSIHTGVRLRNGQVIQLRCLHPRPPEPVRDQDSAPRDAELVVVGREVGNDHRPTIVAGDLNDVAWSWTTTLFQRLSKLLDPRKGRGFYNTYNAYVPFFRFSLDHIFHSDSFRLVEIRRMGPIGSDHFPILAELSYEPDAQAVQEEPELQSGDEREAQEIVNQQEAQSDEVESPCREAGCRTAGRPRAV